MKSDHFTSIRRYHIFILGLCCLGTIAPLLLAAPAAHADIVGEYFNNATIGNNYMGTRLDTSVHSPEPAETTGWGGDGPNMYTGSDDFTIRWRGFINIPTTSAAWQFQVGSDDGSSLYIDGARVINQFGSGAGTWQSAALNLAAGQHSVVLNYHENGGSAAVDLYWNGGSGATYSLIPAANLSASSSWNWDANVTCGWGQANMTSVVASGGQLVATYSNYAGGDPNINGPALAGGNNPGSNHFAGPYIRPGIQRYLQTSIKLGWVGADESFQFYFARRGETPDDTTLVYFNVIADNQFHTYTVDLQANTKWASQNNTQNEVEWLRLDPGIGGAAYNGRQVFIDYLNFVGGAHEVSSTRLSANPISETDTYADYLVRFSEPVNNVDGTDFNIFNNGTGSTASVLSVTQSFNQTYNFTAAPVGWTAVGNALLNADGRMHLTENVGGQQGSLISDVGTIPLCKAFRVRFDVRAYNTGNDPADGYSFEYGALNGGSFGEYGQDGTTGLKVCFVTYAGGTNGRHVEIRYPDNNVRCSIPYNARDQYTSAVNQRVIITVREDGRLDVSHQGVHLIQNLNLSQWGTWNPQSTWRMGIGARTGGAYENHYIDNLRIVNSDYTVRIGGFGGSPTGTLRLDLADTNNLTDMYGYPIHTESNGYPLYPHTFTSGEVYDVNRCAPATITVDPSPQTASYLDSATFTVTATGTSMSYSWSRSDASPIANGSKYVGQGTNSLTVYNCTNADAVNFTCAVTNNCGNDTSAPAALTVTGDPHFTSTPGPVSVIYGQNAQFTAEAVGSNFTYVWYKVGIVPPLSDGTKYLWTNTAYLAILNCTNADEGQYYCIITDSTNPAKTVTSPSGQLTVTGDPRFTLNPAAQTVAFGSPATFTVTAEGSSFGLLWYKQGVGALSNDAKYSGVTTNTLLVANCANADEGQYYCVATDTVYPSNTATSGSALLTVTGDPSITGQPSPTTVGTGGTANFTVTVVGSNYGLQWYKQGVGALADGIKYSGATSDHLVINNCGTGDIGDYYCVATDNAIPSESDTSDTALLTLSDADPHIVTSPQPATVDYNTQASFTVVFAGSNFAVQWYKQGDPTPLSAGPKYAFTGVNGQTLQINNCFNADEGYYYAIARDISLPGNTAQSDVDPFGHLTVNDPVVQTQPSNVIAPFNTPATFTTAIQGSGYTLQWFRSGDPSPLVEGAKYVGVTTASLRIENCGNIDEDSYYCVATADAPDGDVATTTPATLTVTGDPAVTSSATPVTVDFNDTATFTITVEGGGFTVEWFRANASTIPLPDGGGKTSYSSSGSSYSLSIYDCAQADEDAYFAVVTDNTIPSRRVLSTPATLTVNDPIITLQPTGASLYPTEAITFTMDAIGTEPLTFQWLKDSGPISGATNKTFTLNSVEPTDQGDYTCEANGADGAVSTGIAHLEVYAPPTILSATGSQTVDPGNPATFSVSAAGTAPLFYQWRIDGADIGGATGTSFTINFALQTDEGDYTCYVHNAAGDFCGRNVSSPAARLTVNDPPTILLDPIGLTTDYHVTATFSVTGDGLPLPAYQWQKDNVDIPNATSNVLTIAAPTNADEGWYACNLVNSAGVATSASADLVVNDPTITQQPPDRVSIGVGGTRSFSVAAVGSDPLAYQWFKDGELLPAGGSVGMTNTPTLTISNAQLTDSGAYYCAITGGDGAISSTATVTVSNPAVEIDPVSQTVNPGAAVIFSAEFGGLPPFSYEWMKDSAMVESGTVDTGPPYASSFSIGSVQETDEGLYWVHITNSMGEATSASAVLSVNDPPVFSNQPHSQTVDPTDSATFFVVLSKGTAPITYQWVKDGNTIAGATDAAYTVASADGFSSGWYHCEVTNITGMVESSYALLTVTDPPIITDPTGPSTVVKNPGDSLTLTVTAIGSEPLAYQWRKDGGNIDGATLNTYYIPSIAADARGSYACAVSNSAGTKLGTNPVSPAVTLMVNSPVEILTPASPQSSTVNPGDSITFTVTFDGTAPFTYEWSKGGASLQSGTVDAGAYETTFTVSGIQESDQGDYVCHVSNMVNGLDAPIFTLDVRDPPTFTAQPQPRTVNYGDSVSFTASATGFLPIDYQWKLNNAPVSEDPPRVTGTTSPTLLIQIAVNDDEGSYTCVATNAAGTATSDAATLEVHDPAITGQPTNQTVLINHSATFTVDAVGSSLTYQWYKGAAPLADDTDTGKILGATTPSLTVANCQLADEGAYHCVVGGGFDPPVTSDDASLDVNDPAILPDGQPQDQTVNPGEPASFTVVVDPGSTPPISYLWFKGAQALTDTAGKIEGATTATLTILDCQEADEALYHVQVTGQHVINSNDAALSVNNPVAIQSIAANPVSGNVNPGDAFTITVQLQPGYTTPVTYQWSKDSVPLNDNALFSGTKSDILSCASTGLSEEGNYTVEVENVVGPVTSSVVRITVGSPVVFGEQPQNAMAYVGENAQFRVGVSGGTGTVHYQWYFNDGAKVVMPVGSDSNVLNINLATTAYVGSYWCVVSDLRGDNTSSTATLDVANHVVITRHPAGGTFGVDQPLTLSVNTTGGFLPLTYEWMKDGVSVGSGSELVFDALLVTDTGSYMVIVSDMNTDAIASHTARVAVVTTEMPVAGTAGLALLALLAAVAGAINIRRKK